MADEAINTCIFMLNADNVRPLIAPPVPIIPAKNPDKIPPKILFEIVGFIFAFWKKNKIALNTIRKTDNTNSNHMVEINLLQ